MRNLFGFNVATLTFGLIIALGVVWILIETNVLIAFDTKPIFMGIIFLYLAACVLALAKRRGRRS
jgi:hypothetical protein